MLVVDFNQNLKFRKSPQMTSVSKKDLIKLKTAK